MQVEARRLWHHVYKRAFRHPGLARGTRAAHEASTTTVPPSLSRSGAAVAADTSATGGSAAVAEQEFLDFVLLAVRDVCSELGRAGSRRGDRAAGGAGASYAELETVVRRNWRSDMPLELPGALSQLVDLSCVYVVDEGGRDGRDRQYRPIRA